MLNIIQKTVGIRSNINGEAFSKRPLLCRVKGLKEKVFEGEKFACQCRKEQIRGLVSITFAVHAITNKPKTSLLYYNQNQKQVNVFEFPDLSNTVLRIIKYDWMIFQINENHIRDEKKKTRCHAITFADIYRITY